ncbi:MAG: phosphomannose isomerase type II C-terminal cupin domain [Spirochaetes bacterium]|nr:phosphomannose isomerase type II C-terminal cupin domain [Spirochaetota bacterium]
MEKNITKSPWGYFEVLSENDSFKLKKIVLLPGKRLSLQKHKLREEHWYILDGEAVVTLNGKDILLKKNQSLDIKKEDIHRVSNKSEKETVLIEIQTGTYFGEDDIERYEDDYGRCSK